MGEIEKKKDVSIEEVQNAILSFNDANIVTNIFKQLGWSVNEELLETISIARQSINLASKLSAIKYLRKLLNEAAEASGMLAKVSRTVPGQDGGMTTFSATQMAQSLNPTKKVESTELNQEKQNDRQEQKPEPVEIGRGRPRTESTRDPSAGIDTNELFAPGTQRLGESGNAGGENGTTDKRSDKSSTGEHSRDETSECEGPDAEDGRNNSPSESANRRQGERKDRKSNTGFGIRNPCVQHRPPNGSSKLFPGVSSAEGKPEE